ncbi:MAG: protein-export chaperone SecB [Rickettsiales bacterium]|jgi:preprotein translocase subunit SecB|nr:protein-export chaperone SecB [Rickettsiales bacterium]
MENVQPKPEFEILNQYIKDLSFEAPSSPRIFFEKLEGQPKIDMNLEVKTAKMGDELYEVVMNLKITNTLADKPLFVIELAYGSMAAVHITEEEALKRLLTKTIPSHLFPFIRAVIAGVTADSGFSPFVLNPINFDKVELK